MVGARMSDRLGVTQRNKLSGGGAQVVTTARTRRWVPSCGRSALPRIDRTRVSTVSAVSQTPWRCRVRATLRDEREHLVSATRWVRRKTGAKPRSPGDLLVASNDRPRTGALLGRDQGRTLGERVRTLRPRTGPRDTHGRERPQPLHDHYPARWTKTSDPAASVLGAPPDQPCLVHHRADPGSA